MKKTQNKKGIQKYSKQLIAIAVALVVIIGGSYAWLTLTLNGTKTNVIKAGTLDITLDESASDGITMENALPISDADGMKTTAYTFKVKNNGNISSNYTIYLKDNDLAESETRMSDSVVKYSLTKNDAAPVTALLNTKTNVSGTGREIATGTVAAGKEDTYSLKLWIDSEATNAVMGNVFSASITGEASQVKE